MSLRANLVTGAMAVLLASGCGSTAKAPPDIDAGSGTGGTGGTGTGGTGTGGTGGTGTGGTGTGGTGGVATGGSGGAATGGAGGATGMGGRGGSGGAGGAAGAGGTTGAGGRGGAGGAAGAGGASGAGGRGGTGGMTAGSLSFFITSEVGSANLGGLDGADGRCKRLATAVGAGQRNWRAYLSTEVPAVNARDRIGTGPWWNAKGVMIAESLTGLHDGAMARNNLNGTTGIDEKGGIVPGRVNRPAGTQNEHDILTGSDWNGMLVHNGTCADWRSESGGGERARVGHFDRDGGGGALPMSSATSWNSAHDSSGCSLNALRGSGGAGRFYCFAAD